MTVLVAPTVSRFFLIGYNLASSSTPVSAVRILICEQRRQAKVSLLTLSLKRKAFVWTNINNASTAGEETRFDDQEDTTKKIEKQPNRKDQPKKKEMKKCVALCLPVNTEN